MKPTNQAPPPAIRKLISNFSSRPTVSRCRTRDGAFNRCLRTSHMFLRHLRGNNIEAEVVRVEEALFNFTSAHPKWLQIGPVFAVHYLVDIPSMDLYIDWTFRQFDPKAAFPLALNDRQMRKLWGIQMPSL